VAFFYNTHDVSVPVEANSNIHDVSVSVEANSYFFSCSLHALLDFILDLWNNNQCEACCVVFPDLSQS
jgi:hypothetical protein